MPRLKKILEDVTTTVIGSDKKEEKKSTKTSKKETDVQEEVVVEQVKETPETTENIENTEVIEKTVVEDSDLPELVVGADLEETDTTTKEKPVSNKTNKTMPKEVAKQPQLHKNVGTKSEDIIESPSEKEIENDIFNNLKRYQRQGEILWGTVYGVEPNERYGEAVISVLYNGVRISIPAHEYFEDSYNFGVTYNDMNDHQKMQRQMLAVRYQIGASVCFVVKGVAREKIKDDELFEDEYDIFAVGSRKEAMAKLRDIWFYHKNRKSSTKQPPRTVNTGDQFDAHVLQVREDMVVVECCGVETRIDNYNVSNSIVMDCTDYTKPGDTIRVRVRKLHISPTSVYLLVTGRLHDSTKLIRSMKPKSTYLGKVAKYNDKSKFYTVTLKNGVNAAVRTKNVQGEIDLSIGDIVAVTVTSIRPTYVVGLAMKI